MTRPVAVSIIDAGGQRWFLDCVATVDLSFESGETSLSFRSFDIREAMSRCFRASVVAMSPDDDLDLDALVGRPAALRIEGPGGGASRVLRGVCLSAEQVQAEETGLSTYAIEIGPKLALLEHRSSYRIFQHQSVLDIVGAVFTEWGIEAKLALDRQRYPRLPYRVQLGETDLAFVSRLLEEAGVSFTFVTDDAPGAPDVLLEDASHLNKVAVVAQHIEQPVEGAPGPYVTRVRVGRKLRAGRVVLRDQHFRLRADVKLVGDVAVMRRAAGWIDGGLAVAQVEDASDAWQVPPRCIPVWQVADLPADLVEAPIGRIDARAGRAGRPGPIDVGTVTPCHRCSIMRVSPTVRGPHWRGEP